MMSEDRFIEDVVQDVFPQLTEKDKRYLLANPNPIDHHFGLGLYIRNKYIHGKNLRLGLIRPDNLSTKIVGKLIEMVRKEVTDNGGR